MISPESTKTSGERENPKTPLLPIHEDEEEAQSEGMEETVPSSVDPPTVVVETNDVTHESNETLDELIKKTTSAG